MSERSKRFPANYPVIMRKGPDMYPAKLCNISASGGCIVASRKLSKGETTLLDYEVGQTRATVMWTAGNMAGLRFDSQLSPFGLNCIRAMTEIVYKAG